MFFEMLELPVSLLAVNINEQSSVSDCASGECVVRCSPQYELACSDWAPLPCSRFKLVFRTYTSRHHQLFGNFFKHHNTSSAPNTMSFSSWHTENICVELAQGQLKWNGRNCRITATVMSWACVQATISTKYRMLELTDSSRFENVETLIKSTAVPFHNLYH